MSSSLVALVLIGAISVALEEITNKHLVRKLGNEFAQIALVNFLTVAWIPAIVFVIIPGINKLGIVSLEAKLILNVGWPAFWFAMIVAILNIVIRFLDFKSYLDDMSKIAPIKGVTIIFLVPVGYFYLNEKLEPLGIIGLAIIAMGVWLLGFKDLKFRTLISGVLSPLASLWRCRETRYALLAAFIASFALVNEKRAVMSVADEIAAAFSIVFLYKFALAFMALTITPFYARIKNKPVRLSWGNFKFIWIVGMFSAVQQICFFSAYQLTEAAYAGSFKRLWVVFGVIFGWLFFKEKKIIQRLFISLVIFLGVFIAYYYGK